jgi:hypothetical protein
MKEEEERGSSHYLATISAVYKRPGRRRGVDTPDATAGLSIVVLWSILADLNRAMLKRTHLARNWHRRTAWVLVLDNMSDNYRCIMGIVGLNAFIGGVVCAGNFPGAAVGTFYHNGMTIAAFVTAYIL